jgi:hypothetical protein
MNKMKNLILLILLLFTVKSYAQEYPLHYKGDVPDGAYYKDTNNEYNKYLGLWKGNWNGKMVYIELKKVKYYYDGVNPYYMDKIFGERKIIASNGTIEIDRITNFDYEDSEIRGMGLPTGVNGMNYPSLMFYPDNMCNMFARLVITNITTTQMTLHLVGMMGHQKANCIHDAYIQQYGEFPINFPKDIVLTKQ